MSRHLGRRTIDGKATKYIVADDAEVTELGMQLELDRHTLNNLRQLCNFGGRLKTGSGSKKTKVTTGTEAWQLLHDIVWLQQKGSDLLEPAIGATDFVHKSVPGLSSSVPDTSLAKLLQPNGRPSSGTWKRVPTPAAAIQLGHGASLRIKQSASDGTGSHYTHVRRTPIRTLRSNLLEGSRAARSAAAHSPHCGHGTTMGEGRVG